MWEAEHLSEKLKRRRHMEDLNVKGKKVLKKLSVRVWTGFIWLRIWTSGELHEHGSEPLSSMRDWFFLVELLLGSQKRSRYVGFVLQTVCTTSLHVVSVCWSATYRNADSPLAGIQPAIPLCRSCKTAFCHQSGHKDYLHLTLFKQKLLLSATPEVCCDGTYLGPSSPVETHWLHRQGSDSVRAPAQ
jgi:hypothetical protein